ncbi:MAG TPA: hypothetical protein VGL94_22740 [Ktedonobacteraceae bacterium]
MISITSETKSVQINSIEETKVNQETKGNQIANRDQMFNENQMEAFPIAEGTTSGEQGGSKTYPGESANKYGHAIFAGWAGENYLSCILKQILPYALWRTWWIAVSHQAPGKSCYVGVAAMARKEKVGERKIEIDLQELQARGLMSLHRERHAWPQPDGTIKYGTVPVKDFSKLYDLAYEYHLWIHSPEYVEAEWDNAEDIRKDARLCLKLMRFDNYRHILTCQKPGPKAKRTPLQETYHYQLPEANQDQGAQLPRTGDPKANLYLNPSENVSSPYRESKNQESYLSKENSFSKKDLEEGVFADVEHRAIRKTQQRDQVKIETKEQITSKVKEEQTKCEEVVKKDQREFGGENPKKIEIKQKEEMGGTAKEEEIHTIEDLKQNPIAMIAFLLQLEEQERLKQEQEQAKKKHRHHKDQSKRKRLTTPEQLARIITQIMQDLGGNPKSLQSDLTRVTKIYWACTQIFRPFTNVWFLERLYAALAKTRRARKVHSRVPYFFTTLESELQLFPDELVYIRSQEALYRDGDLKTFVLGLQQSYHKSGSQLEYQEWVKQTYHLS